MPKRRSTPILITLFCAGLVACAGIPADSDRSDTARNQTGADADDKPGYPLGEFVIISARRASNVAAPLLDMDEIPIGNSAEFYSDTNIRLDDAKCDDWQLLGSFSPTIFPEEDPLLFDVALGPADGSTDHRHDLTYEIFCEGESVTRFLRIDDRVLVFPTANDAINVILEKPLKPHQIRSLQDALAASDHYAGETTGMLTPETVEAVRQWMMAQDDLDTDAGVPMRPALTENLLTRLGVDTE